MNIFLTTLLGNLLCGLSIMENLGTRIFLNTVEFFSCFRFFKSTTHIFLKSNIVWFKMDTLGFLKSRNVFFFYWKFRESTCLDHMLLLSVHLMSWVHWWLDLDLFTTQFSDKVLLDTWKLVECEQNRFWEGFGWFLQMYLVALCQKIKL